MALLAIWNTAFLNQEAMQSEGQVDGFQSVFQGQQRDLTEGG